MDRRSSSASLDCVAFPLLADLLSSRGCTPACPALPCPALRNLLASLLPLRTALPRCRCWFPQGRLQLPGRPLSASSTMCTAPTMVPASSLTCARPVCRRTSSTRSIGCVTVEYNGRGTATVLGLDHNRPCLRKGQRSQGLTLGARRVAWLPHRGVGFSARGGGDADEEGADDDTGVMLTDCSPRLSFGMVACSTGRTASAAVPARAGQQPALHAKADRDSGALIEETNASKPLCRCFCCCCWWRWRWRWRWRWCTWWWLRELWHVWRNDEEAVQDSFLTILVAIASMLSHWMDGLACCPAPSSVSSPLLSARCFRTCESSIVMVGSSALAFSAAHRVCAGDQQGLLQRRTFQGASRLHECVPCGGFVSVIATIAPRRGGRGRGAGSGVPKDYPVLSLL
jgi:hypothetical protein